MDERTSPVDLAERVAQIADALGIRTVMIGGYALAAHHFVRATSDIDLATDIDLDALRRLEAAVTDAGLATRLSRPDEEDPLGGVLVVWAHADDDGDPIDAVEIVNFKNPHRPRQTPARAAIENGIPLEEKPALRYPRLADLIALKLYADDAADDADVVNVLAANPSADLEEIKATCMRYGYARIDELIERARAKQPRR